MVLLAVQVVEEQILLQELEQAVQEHQDKVMQAVVVLAVQIGQAAEVEVLVL